ncbi:Formylglycine-generating enzyme, required for sulfatase activity, contains SUMF1/FGE domain [Thermomonospora echinospora]|uniref:Formylglycine-generating enzyme, required for sulfatase activity, contains SUMF1/FGE domain n=1 Tax=Thermomonospora echinospora TaxID=1992 RepID=A0A1H6E9W2_9ACTN|nr:SUMF1/EgtB/PvdO family nonheme iron enzyme [Thermomonospora echinospora]SEG93889.1 Formylglycine-generating enzyme, required for sulfatase activity, contains SUMF1/FGE domain [Thermomonospora echinospora]
MSSELDSRLQRLKTELDDHSRIARHLGLDFERPIRSLGDGYPENSISLVGKIAERILKELWQHHDVPGDPSGKSLSELIKGCRPHITSSAVLDALRDIQLLRNRAAHDGYSIAEEDALTAIRRLLDVLMWFTTTGSQVLTGDVPRLVPAVAKKAEFLAGLYLTMGYTSVKRFELTQYTVYQLFSREVGLRIEYVELMLSRGTDEVRQVLASTGGELLKTRLPKLTRFLVLDPGDDPAVSEFEDYRVVTYDRFMDTIVDPDAHYSSFALAEARERMPLSGRLLTTDERSGNMTLSQVGDAYELLTGTAVSGGNLLVVGRSGSGKTVLLQRLVAAGRDSDVRRYRFYFDMSLKRPGESFPDFITRTLAPCMAVDRIKVFDVFHYFARSGSVVCALDGIDEAVTEHTLAGFVELFTELAQVLSADSTVVMSSRVSFLEDSPQVRRMLDGTALLSERLVQNLYAQGVDPLKVPRFSALRLHEDTSPLEVRLARVLGAEEPLPDLLWRHVERTAAEAGLADRMPQLVAFFGRAGLEGHTSFTLIELCNELGIECFTGGRIDFESFGLRPLFRPADADRVAFAHSAYQELFAAEHLRTSGSQNIARPARLTEQLRAFLHHRSRHERGSDDCVLPAGTYLVGPSHHLMLREITAPVRFDRYAVTVRRYNEFLAAVERHGSAQWDHPDMPPDVSHQPWLERLRVQDYYTNPTYADHPAICLSWWSAYAFARFEGKRLPTSTEWEAAARGRDGRLFPWGDEIDLEAVNCADAYSDRPLITYETWLEEHDQGRLRDAFPRPVHAHERNRSPFGVHQLVGNIWERTSTVLADRGESVICGGSFDNPYRAVQTSSKGLAGFRISSNAIGFRCVEEL